MDQSNSAQIIGYVASSQEIEVIDENGNTRLVSAGDPIYLNDSVVGNAQDILITLISNQSLTIPRQQAFSFSRDALGDIDTLPKTTTNVDADADASKLDDVAQRDTPEQSEQEQRSEADEAVKEEPAFAEQYTVELEAPRVEDTLLERLEEEVVVEDESDVSERAVTSSVVDDDISDFIQNYAPTITSSDSVGEADESLPSSHDLFVSDGGIIGFDDANQKDTHTVKVADQEPDYLGTFTVELDAETKTVAWDFNVLNTDVDYLAEGEQLTQIYTVTITDEHDESVDQQVTVTITGSNDIPTIASVVDVVGDIVESGTGELSDNGSFVFADLDVTDTHAVSFTTDADNYLGTFTPTLDQATKTINWNFAVDNSAIDYLAEGEQLIQVYTVTVTDEEGASVDQQVTVTITGSNDIPTIASVVDVVGDIVESGTGELSDNGSFVFADLDVTDTHAVSFTAGADNYLGTFTPTLDQVTKTINWNFAVDNSAIDYLAKGEQLTQTYTLTVTDEEGASVDQQVTITITGSNDIPTIASVVDVVGDITELGTGELSDNGSFVFADLDVTDTHAVSFTAGADNYVGTFTPTLDQATKTISWNFAVNNSAIDYLAAGEQLTQTYTVTVTDEEGASVDQQVTVTITGSNDIPTIASVVDVVGDIVESGTGELSDNGSFVFADLDVTDTHAVSFTAGADNYVGTFTPTLDQATKTINWNFAVDNSAIDYLADGEQLTQTYTVTVTDEEGASVDQQVTVTITGSNDIPTIASVVDVAGDIVESGTGELSDNGSFQFADLDVTDTHAVSFTAGADNYLGTFTPTLDQATKTISWNFAVDNSAIDYLAEGEQLTQTYTVTVTDEEGASVDQQVTVTITGSDDASIVSGDVHVPEMSVDAFAIPDQFDQIVDAQEALSAFENDPKSVLEAVDTLKVVAADGAWVRNISLPTDGSLDGKTIVIERHSGYPFSVSYKNHYIEMSNGSQNALVLKNHQGSWFSEQEMQSLYEDNDDTLNASGQLTISDVDVADSKEFVAETIQGSYGELSINASGFWHYVAQNSQAAIQRLGKGESVSDTVTVQTIEGAEQQITVTLQGTNDTPTITAVTDVDGAIVESGSGELSDNGLFQFADLDVTDTHAVSFTAGADNYVGTFTPTLDQATKTISWNFAVDNGAIEYLAEGEQLTQIYTVTVTDEEGASVDQQVTVTITGSNDIPTIASVVDVAGDIVESGTGELSDNGSFQFADLDVTDVHSVSFTAGADDYVGTFTPTLDQASKTVNWDFTVDNSAIDYLAEGEQLTQNYTVTVTDEEGASVDQQVTLAITGSNDIPTIASVVDVAGDIIESGTGELSDNGSFQFADLDVTDTHTMSFTAGADNYLGTFTPTLDQATKTVNWNFAVDNSAIDYLAEGEQLTQTYTVTVTDEEGASVDQQVTVTITGSDDASIVSGDVHVPEMSVDAFAIPDQFDQIVDAQEALSAFENDPKSVLEGVDTLKVVAADGAWVRNISLPTDGSLDGKTIVIERHSGYSFSVSYKNHYIEMSHGSQNALVLKNYQGSWFSEQEVQSLYEDNGDTLNASGQLTISDVDVADSKEFVAETIQGSYGELSIDASGVWHYVAQNSQAAIQGLGEGESVSDTVTVQTIEGAEQQITVTLQGTNDTPTITAVTDVDGVIVESGSGELSDNGSFVFADLDVTDTHAISFTAGADNYVGTFTPTLDQATKTINWNFAVDNSAIDYLADGEQLTQTYTVTVTDEEGASVDQQVTVTITGSNDIPTIASVVDVAGDIVESGTGELSDNGSFQFADLDVTDTHAVSFTAGAANYVGTFTPTLDQATKTVNWNFAVDNSAIDYLAEGEQLTQTYTVTVTDEEGASVDQQVTVTITGSDDASIVSGDVHVPEMSVDAFAIPDQFDQIVDAQEALSAFENDPKSVLEGVDTLKVVAADGAWVRNISLPTDGSLDGKTIVIERHSGYPFSVSYKNHYIEMSNGSQNALVLKNHQGSWFSEQEMQSLYEDNDDTLNASGQLTISDVDVADSKEFVAETIQGSYGELSINASGFWHYVAQNSQAAIQRLGKGESVSDTVTVQTIEGAEQQITVTLQGTNDTPTITAVTDVDGAIVESGSGELSDNGLFQFADLDVTDTHAVSFTAGADNYVGTFTPTLDQATKTISWNFAVDNGAIEYLAEGEQLTQIYTVTVTDEEGASVDQQVTVTITGSNDIPTIASVVDVAGDIVESGTGELSDNGSFQFADLDVTDVHSVSFTAGADDYVGTFTPTLDQASKTVNWDFTVDNSAIDYLAEGEQLTQNYTVTVTDEEGASVDQQVTLAITGSNDIPTIASVVDVAGDIIESGTGELSDNGSFQFADLDVTDTHTMSFTAGADNYLGTFTPTLDQATKTVNWNFAVDNSAIDYLAEGEQLTQTYTVTVTDEEGASVDQQVTVTITGSDDASIVSGDVHVPEMSVDAFAIPDQFDQIVDAQEALSAFENDPKSVLEGVDTLKVVAADGAWVRNISLPTDGSLDGKTIVIERHSGYSFSVSYKNHYIEMSHGSQNALVLKNYQGSWFSEQEVQSLYEDNGDTLNASGQLTISDVDVADSKEFVAETIQGSYGELSIDASGVWHYVAQNSQAAIQGLGEGESVSDTVTVQTIEGAEQQITVTLQGTNDTPTITAVTDVDGVIVESGSGELSDNGSFVFADLDVTDTHAISFTAGADNYVGTFTPTLDQATKTINWNFAVDNSAIDYLADGEQLTQTYTVTVTDEEGASVDQQVTVTITGSNDIPTIASVVDVAGDIVESGTGELSDNGSFQFADLDVTDTHAVSFTAGAANYVGTFTPTLDQATKTVNWNFAVDNSAIDYLAEGEQLTQTYTVTVTDEEGASVDQQVTVTITGSDDASIVSGDVHVPEMSVDAFAIPDQFDQIVDAQEALSAFENDPKSVLEGVDTLKVVAADGAWVRNISLPTDGSLDGKTIVIERHSGYPFSVSYKNHYIEMSNGSQNALVLKNHQGSWFSEQEMQSLYEDNDDTLNASGQLTISDVDVADSKEFVAETIQGSYGELSINASGFWHYVAQNSQAAIQRLGKGESVSDTVTVQTIEGAEQQITVTLQGTNDTPTITAVTDVDGAIVESGSGELSDNGLFQFADLDVTDTHAVSFTAGADNYVGTFTPTLDQATKTISWNFAVDNGAIEYLAEGEQLTQIYTVTVTDEEGASVDQQVTVTITGSNDIPTIASVVDVAGDIVESGTGELSDNGSFQFADLDVTDTHAVSFTAGADNYLGTFTPTLNQATKMVNWNFAVDNSAIDYLADGEQLTQTYTVTITDEEGASVDQEVTVTITGSNDVPTISNATNVPILISGGKENIITSLGFESVEVSGSYRGLDTLPDGWSGAGWYEYHNNAHGRSDGYEGSQWLELDSDNRHDFLTYNVDTSDQKTHVLEIAVANHMTGGSANGTNDVEIYWGGKHVTTLTPTDEWVLHRIELPNEEGDTTELRIQEPANQNDYRGGYIDAIKIIGIDTSSLFDGGSFQFADLDVTDVHSVSFTAGADDYVGTFTPTLDQASKTVNWNFTADNSAIDYLAEGEQLTQTYTVTITDTQGASVDQQVILTMTGSNDIPTIASVVDIAGDIVESGTEELSDNGSFQFADLDVTDTHALSFTAGADNYLGTFTPTLDQATKTINWNFAVDNSAIDYLAEGEQLTQTYTVTVTDEEGASVDQQVTVTITGSDDASIVSGDVHVPEMSVDAFAIPDQFDQIVDAQEALSAFENDPKSVLEGVDTLKVVAADGAWVRNISLPTDGSLDGKTIVIERHSGYSFSVSYKNHYIEMSHGSQNALVLKNHQGSWFSEQEMQSLYEDNGDTLNASGQLTISDVDVADSKEFVAETIQGSYGELSINASGFWHYVAQNSQAAIQELGEGESVSDTVTVQTIEGAEQQITVTLQGTNDTPTITAVTDVDGVIVESGSGELSDNGSFQFADLDVTDTHAVSFTAGADNYLGTFTPTLDQATKTISWNFAVDNNAIAYLADGEQLTQTYTVTVTDEEGASVDQQVTVTITGSNDVPYITNMLVAEPITLDFNWGGESITNHAESITLPADYKFGDTFWLLESGNPVHQKAVAIKIIDNEDGSLNIKTVAASYAMQSTLNNLSESEQKTFFSDGRGTSMSLSINGGAGYGIKDVSINGSDVVQGYVDNSAGINVTPAEIGKIVESGTGELSDNGSFQFADLDITDTHAVSFTAGADNYVGTFTPTLDQATKTVNWNFAVDNSAIDYLAEGEQLTQTYTVTVTDEEGASVDQQVTVTITGSNDIPTIASVVDVAGDIIESGIGELSDNGSFQFADLDITDTHAVSFTAGAANYVGTFTPTLDQATKTVNWNFAVDNSAIDYLAEGEQLTQTYTVTVTDEEGASVDQQVKVTITGSNDAPIITQDSDISGVAVPEKEVVALYDMKSGSDLSEQNHQLTLNNGASLNNDSLEFNSAGAALDTLQLGGAITIASTFTYHAYSPWARIIDFASAGPAYSIVIGSSNNGALSVYIAYTENHSVAERIEVPNAYSIGETFHMALSVAENGHIYLYKNGVLIGENPNGHPIVDVPRTTNFLGKSNWSDPNTNGSMSDLVILNNYSDASEIAKLYQLSSEDNLASYLSDALVDSGSLIFDDLDASDTHTVSFAADADNYVGTFTPTLDQATKTIYWDFKVDSSDIDYLAEGEQLTQTYTVTVTDAEGASVDQQVTLTMTGSNDIPTIASVVDVAGDIVESDTGELSDNGSFVFADSDVTDVHSVSFTAGSDNYVGTFTPTLDQATKTINWNFTVDNSAIDYLAEGELLTQTYTVTVTDEEGASVDQQVTVTITGSHDGPVIEKVLDTDSITIDFTWGGASLTNSDHSYTLPSDFVSGDIVWFTTQGDSQHSGHVKAVAVEITEGNDGSYNLRTVKAAYTDSAALEGFTQSETSAYFSDGNGVNASLAQGAGQGGYGIQNVSINGSEVVTGYVTETSGITLTPPSVIGRVTESDSGGLSDSGFFNFAVSGAADTYTVSSATNADNYVGTFTPTLDQVNETVNWNFAVDKSAIDYLAEGEQLTQTYTVTITDAQGASVDQQVAVTITGSNSGPTIATVVDVVGDIVESGTGELSDNGSFQFADLDVTDVHSVAFTAGADNYLGTFTPTLDQATKTINWNFAVDNSAIDYLAEGEQLTQTYTVTITDAQGASVDQQVTVTITGTNGVPTISNATNDPILVSEGKENIITSLGFESVEVANDWSGTNALPDGWSGAGWYEYHSNANGRSDGYEGSQWLELDSDNRHDFLTYNVDTSDQKTHVLEIAVTNHIMDDRANGTNDVEIYWGGKHVTTLTPTDEWVLHRIELPNEEGDTTELRIQEPVNQNDYGGGYIDAIKIIGIDTNSLFDTGSFQFTDLDVTDAHTVSFNAGADDYVGTFIPTLDQATKTVNWDFTVDSSAIDYLAEGEQLTQTYTVTVTDTQGTSVDQQVTLTMTGGNDAPIITQDSDISGAVEPEKEIVALYDMKSDNDLSVQNHQLTLNNGASLNNGTLEFNNAGAALDTLQLDGAITIASTFTYTSHHGWARILDFASEGPSHSIVIGSSNNGTLSVYIVYGDNHTVADRLDVPNFYSIGETFHVALSVAENGHMYLYKNGVLAGENPNGHPIVDTVRTNNFLGKSNWSSDPNTNGSMSDLVILNNYSDASEIAKIYQLSSEDNLASYLSDVLTDSGSLMFDDVDVSDTHTVSFAADADNYVGTFTPTLDQATKAIHWEFKVDSSDIAYLADGEQLTQTYTVTVTDTQGASVDQQVTVTITGSNDIPTIASVVDVAGDIVESGSGELSDSGSFQFADLDVTDAHTMSFTAGADNYVGTFTPTLDQATKTINWNFAVDNNAINYLAEGEQLTQTYTVTVTDENGASVDQQVVVTIRGNVAPEINSDADVSGLISHSEEMITSVDFESPQVATYGLYSDSIGDGWSHAGLYELHSNIDGRTQGYTGSQWLELDSDGRQDFLSYNVDTNDHEAHVLELAVAARPLSSNAIEVYWDNTLITTLNPTSQWVLHRIELPSVAGDVATLKIQEPANHNSGAGSLVDAIKIIGIDTSSLSDSGSFEFVDLNTDDTHTMSFVADADNYVGTFTPTFDEATKTVNWNFIADNSAVENLAAGEQLTQTYTVTVTDEHGASVDQQVAVKLVGAATAETSADGETLIGDANDNIFVIGHDDTTATGGDGADIFDFRGAGDSADPVDLIINDFNTGDGDVLMLDDLLVDENDSLDHHLHFETQGADTLLEIREQPDGDVTKTVTFKNTDFSGLGANDTEIINNLLSNHNLDMDSSS